MTNRAPAEAPVSNPMMSGEPSGLRVRDWKTAPEIASAQPARTAHSARGSRRSRTMKDVPGSPPPQRRDHVARREVQVTGPDREHQQAGGDEREDGRHRHGPAADAHGDRVADAQGPALEPGPGGGDDHGRRVRHSAAIRFRRTIAMNTGAPTSATMTPACNSLGRTSTRPRRPRRAAARRRARPSRRGSSAGPGRTGRAPHGGR